VRPPRSPDEQRLIAQCEVQAEGQPRVISDHRSTDDIYVAMNDQR